MHKRASDAPAMAVRVLSAMAEIDRAAWDGFANPGWRADGTPDCASQTESAIGYNPFLTWDFLEALEAAGCATSRTGWLPQHLMLTGPGDEPAGVMPCYLKSHSQGEYVFDYGWADAFERAGGRYYPKLQVSVPFTPVTGRRLLVRPDADEERNMRALATGLAALCERHEVSSAHLTFLTEREAALLDDMGYLMRTDQQFHWTNEGFATFEDFLAALASRKRKAVRRERKLALENDIEIKWITGGDITEAHWDAFYSFYMDTGSRKWGRPYLNRRFFSLLSERLASRVLLIFAMRGGRPVAGALNLIGSDTLYGRYWGCTEDHPFLHFEVCYYHAIDFALANGLKCVEAGAQGAHKLARGYMPVATRSAHFIANQSFRRAVEDYLDHERGHAELERRAIAAHGPFRKVAGQ